MAKPKAKETVVWDDDDVWSDVEPEPPASPPPATLQAPPPETPVPTAVPSPPPAAIPPPAGRGISLTKNRTVTPAPADPPKAAPITPSPQAPPPLPAVFVKPAPQPTPAPPPLPVQSTVFPSSIRKPPSGVSSIFLRGTPADAKAPEDEPPPKPKIPHPKLGPAFARENPPDNEA